MMECQYHGLLTEQSIQMKNLFFNTSCLDLLTTHRLLSSRLYLSKMFFLLLPHERREVEEQVLGET